MVKELLESLFLPFIAFKVKLQELLWQSHVQRCYYSNTIFKACDEELSLRYAKCTPYEISKQFMLHRRAKEIHVYGETPLKLYDEMARRWGLQSNHHFVELGCGRGRGLLFLASFYGCNCRGIEWIEAFVQKGKDLHPNVHFYHEDFITSSHLDGDFFYLYGTCLEEEAIIKLCTRFLALPKGCKIVTVSFPLNEYHEAFKTIDTFEGVFPWGKGNLFLNKRKE